MPYQNQKNQQGKLKEIGVLWKKTSKSNKKFLSGVFNLKNIGGKDEDVPVIIFPNTFKEEGSAHPDLKIYLSEPREGAPAARPAAPKKAYAPSPKFTPRAPAAPVQEEQPQEESGEFI